MTNKVGLFRTTGDANGRVTDSLSSPSYVNNYALSASTAKSVTVPSGARVAVFNSDANLWVRYDGSDAAIPASDVTDGTGSELNPAARDVSELQSLSIIAAAACKVSISFYR